MGNYEEIRAVNWSTLKNIDVSPLMYKHRLANPEPRKPAYVVGAAAHCAILEPDEFDRRYAVYEGTRRGEAWSNWQEEHVGVEALKPDEWDAVCMMAAAVHQHRVAAGLLKSGRREAVVTWTDPDTGLACKGRLDCLRPDLVLDLKTARDVSPFRFGPSAFRYGYAAQCAWYHDGAFTARLLTRPERPYVVAVQNVEPWDVAVYQLDGNALDVGRAQYRAMLRRLSECISADYWPGCAPDLQQLSPPKWATNQMALDAEEDF